MAVRVGLFYKGPFVVKKSIIAAALCLLAGICVFLYISVLGNKVEEGGINPLLSAETGMDDKALPSDTAYPGEHPPHSIPPVAKHGLPGTGNR